MMSFQERDISLESSCCAVPIVFKFSSEISLTSMKALGFFCNRDDRYDKTGSSDKAWHKWP